MKKLFLIMTFLAVTLVNTYAQCDKKIILSSGKTDYLNSSGEVQKSEDEITTVEYDKKEIIISPGNEQSMQGTIISTTCEWKTPFKDGKTVIKVALNGPQGETKNITVTIEGKEGKISFIAEFDDNPDIKIRLMAEKFEEKK